MTPVLIVVAYNREHALQRLLDSLQAADYQGRQNINLIISIDYSGDNNVQRCAEQFNWKHGDKRLIVYRERQGLRQHILNCGDLTTVYKSAIILEDDLFVSPHFYEYSVQAAKFYNSDARIAGISLYTMRRNETASRPFESVADGSDA